MNTQTIEEVQPATTHISPVSIDCPECGASVDLGARPMLHEIVPCADCGVELEVLSLEPLTVDLAPEVEEDWGE